MKRHFVPRSKLFGALNATARVRWGSRWRARWPAIVCTGIVVIAAYAPLIANHLPIAVWRGGGEAATGLAWPALNALSTWDWFGMFALPTCAIVYFVLRRQSEVKGVFSARGAALLGAAALLVCIVAAMSISRGRVRLDVNDYRAAEQPAWMVSPAISHGWQDVQLEERYQRPGRSERNGEMHLLGTDGAGADVAARLIHGARIAALVGVLSAALMLGVGALGGLCMGYFGGWLDLIGMRVIELFMAAPRLFLVLSVVVFLPTSDSGVSLAALIAVIGLTGWMRPARLMRAEVLRVRHEDYVAAARAMGVSKRSILIRHILPNAIRPALVDGGFMIASAILMETNLSFLGLGVKAPQPSWGLMLSEAMDRSTGSIRWWLAVGPGAMILLVVLSCNALAEKARLRFAAGENINGR